MSNKNYSESAIKYRRSKHGAMRVMLAGIRCRVKKYNREMGFDGDAFINWLTGKPEFHTIYDGWVESGYLKLFKPSVDRVNPLKGYVFENMQVVTWKYNKDKGNKETRIFLGRHIIQCNMFGDHLRRFNSIVEASEALNLNERLIDKVLTGRRNHTGRFRFKYVSEEDSKEPLTDEEASNWIEENRPQYSKAQMRECFKSGRRYKTAQWLLEYNTFDDYLKTVTLPENKTL